MTITAKIVADSISPVGDRLTTMSLRYPRFIHAEFMTHRVFSRNASSSRAIPIEKMIQDVINDPALPVAWGSNKPGMQAGEEIKETYWAEDAWLTARDDAVESAQKMVDLGLHKQIVNRLLEPFAHISVIVTATEWDNFFDLRCHPDADPTIRALAEAMRGALDRSEPVDDATAQFHLPYVAWEDIKRLGEVDFHTGAMISAARCARVSYLNHDGTEPDIEKDMKLADRLLSSKHMSPFEHQAFPSKHGDSAMWGNFRGWDQFRKMIE